MQDENEEALLQSECSSRHLKTSSDHAISSQHVSPEVLLPFPPRIAGEGGAVAEEAYEELDGGGDDVDMTGEAAMGGSSSSSSSSSSSRAAAPAGKTAAQMFKGAYKPSGGDALLSSELKSIRALRLNKLAELRNEAAARMAADGGVEGPNSVNIRVTYLMKQVDLYMNALRPSGGSGSSGSGSAGAGAGAGSSSSSSSGGGRGRRGKHAMDATDESEELAEEEGSGSHGVASVRLTKQPSILQFGTMREYQLEGLNWMISLHDNNMSGILADVSGSGSGDNWMLLRLSTAGQAAYAVTSGCV